MLVLWSINSFAFAEGNHGDLLPFKGVDGFFVIAEVKLQIILFFSISRPLKNLTVSVKFQCGSYMKLHYFRRYLFHLPPSCFWAVPSDFKVCHHPICQWLEGLVAEFQRTVPYFHLYHLPRDRANRYLFPLKEKLLQTKIPTIQRVSILVRRTLEGLIPP